MVTILVSSFVIVCSLGVFAFVATGLRQITRERRALEDEVILAAEPLRPEWIGLRMDVPRRFPLLRTRSSKALR